MKATVSDNFRLRRNYGQIKSVELIPDLIKIQKNSYASFLQEGIPKKQRKDLGLESALTSVFPIYSNNGSFILEYLDYYFDDSKYSAEESKEVGATYSRPLKVRVRLIMNNIDKDTGVVSVQEVKEQDIYFGEIPLMQSNGTFIVNGIEKVVVSQIHRSPGVFFGGDKGKYSGSGKELYSANIIPKRGSWLDFEFDGKDLLYAKIDKRKKFLATILFKCLPDEKSEKLISSGNIQDFSEISFMSEEDILETFYDKFYYRKEGDQWIMQFISSFFRGRKLSYDLVDAKSGEVLVSAGVNINSSLLRKIERKNIDEVIIEPTEIVGKFLASNLKIDSKKNLYTGNEVTEDILEEIENSAVDHIEVLLIDNVNVGPYVLNTLNQDRHITSDIALKEMYRVLKSSDALSLEVASNVFFKTFFDLERYDLSDVGRKKINERLDLTTSNDTRVLTKLDIITICKNLIRLRDGKDSVDDIDNLSNRRIRSVGELVETEVRIALIKIQRNIIEKMNSSVEVMPGELINIRPLQSMFKEFFGISQLSQFMDQTNPLSEITHKRRLSALGPKGLNRDRAGFEVRDVHYTHYGRICPIETPEGPNIGLINSLTIYAKVNQYGFLETPYNKVKDGSVLSEVVYLTAYEEKDKIIAQSVTKVDKSGVITEELVRCRLNDDFVVSEPGEIDYIDISPQQMVSIAAALVPFLENDDANRALMGANMQRQAVPLLITMSPLVGTGMEAVLASSSGVSVVARDDGVVEYVDANKIIVKYDVAISDEQKVIMYKLTKFSKSNHNTCVNQVPLVKIGERITKGEVLADGQACENGELALGKNALVAFLPWNGYNFEDSILVSERMVKDDVFTSVHIEEFEVVARDTKLGPEEITADIPGVNDESLRNLDEAGIIYIGAEVNAGDILVGKITPKAESIVTPEEKLLRAVFGEKALDVRETSLKVSSGVSGVVIGVKVFSRRGVAKDSRSLLLDRVQMSQIEVDRKESHKKLIRTYKVKIDSVLEGEEVVASKALSEGSEITKSDIEETSVSDLFKVIVSNKSAMMKLDIIHQEFEAEIKNQKQAFDKKIAKIEVGDDLPSNVLKMVKVYVAVKRKLQPGDKMAGRHGNKGVISKIVAEEDMPYLEDGTPVDICLNPLGVPSRMNVGQVLEVHLGWAAAKIGQKIYELSLDCKQGKESIDKLRSLVIDCYGEQEKDIIKNLDDKGLMILAGNLKDGLPVATPVFDGLNEQDINQLLDKAGLDTSGQVELFDGRSGEKFERKVTVGYMYILKLHHLVDEKIHARSVGPYSLITQQPLGGKAQFGGQRFGEMEVWALEAYGASYILKEMLTVKSDDQVGRTKVYEAIIKGQETFKTGVPESFNVLVRELRSLGLDMDIQKDSYKVQEDDAVVEKTTQAQLEGDIE